MKTQRKNHLPVSVFVLLLMLAACKKSDGVAPADTLNEVPPAAELGKLSASGTFVSNSYGTSGMAKLYDNAGKKTLVFENFKTDNGPDLLVYLAKDRSASAFREVGRLKAISGNFSYDIASTVDTGQFPFVLVWCEDFAVLFGNAELKKPM